MSDVYNRQYVEYIRCLIAGKLRRVSIEEQSKQLLQILALTMQVPSLQLKEWPEKFWKHHFTKTEMSILLQQSDLFYLQKEPGQSICLLKNMLSYYQNQSISIDFYFRVVTLLLVRLSALMSIEKEYKEQLHYAEEGIRMELVAGNYHMLADFVNNKADALESLGQKEVSLQYYKLAYYCAELMETYSAPISKRSYEKLIGHEVEWY